MPIIGLQRALREIGRLRIGQKTEKGYPTKLDRFRFTSSDRSVIDAAAELYGGKPGRWDGAPVGEQWEVVTDTAQLQVIIPPGPAALSQWYELWSGGGCERRCDGATNVLDDTPCQCDPDQRECKATTRLSIILADLPGLGVWRLESHGYYAATELAGTVDVCQQAAGRGQLLPAVLGLEQRSVKRRDDKGQTVTRNFVVPTLDIKVTPGRIGTTVAGWQHIGTPEPREVGNGDIATAIDNADQPPARRANTAAPIPATGLAPRQPAIVDVEINEARIEPEQPELVVVGPIDTKIAADEALMGGRAGLEARYRTQARALTEARRYAKANGLTQPATFDAIDDELANAILQ